MKLKISELENKIATDKCIITQEFNKLTSKNYTVRLKQSNLASKNDVANFVKTTDFDNKLKGVTSNKNELNELKGLISIKVLTKDLINLVFLMEQNIFLQEYFRII